MRKKLSPDTRLNWRDPNMPVLRYGKVNGVDGTYEIPSDEIRKYYAAKINSPFYRPPSWYEDETYDLSYKKSKKGD